MIRRGFTLYETLWLLGLLLILAAILFPWFGREVVPSNHGMCQKHLATLARAASLYAQDYGGVNAPVAISANVFGGHGVWWMVLYQPYAGDLGRLICPSMTGDAGYCANASGCEPGQPSPTPYRYFGGYGANWGSDWAGPAGQAEAGIRDPPGTFLLMDAPCIASSPSSVALALRHNEGINVAFCDGHVGWLSGAQVPRTATGGWTVTAGD